MPPPGKEFCVYNGNYYTEGQTWYDGCDYKCTCYDAPNNVYTCLSRCPQYEGDFSTCAQVPDPEDPVCCSVPKCNGTALPPGQFTGTGTVPNRDKCIYKGVEYSAGAVWEDGCKLQCECLDSTIGLFECVDKCQKYADLPPQCSLVQDFANRCCMVPQCSPVAAPTPAPSSGGTTLEPPKTVYCQYYQATYYPGQTWADGCERNCRCEDNGLYTCQERCPTYTNLPPTCQLVTDDQDPCCKKPECSTDPQGGATPSPGQIPTLPPKTINGSAYVPNPGQTPNLNACVYNGQQYMQSEKWYDGCDYECVCEDATTGQYTCTERCVQYPKIPPQCQLVKDASNPCCEIPVCDPNYSTPGPNAKTTVTPATVTPPSDVCIYNGKAYTQGQTWNDGCQFSCVCEDATQGIYRCSDRCPAMPNLPQGCYLVPDPRDPLCCESPQCDLLTPPSPDNKGNLVPTLAPAVITGRQVTPSPLPVNAPEKDACIYGGKFYREGQRWTDGCDYNCVCEDGKTGRYTCTEICPQYASLPPQCVYVSDPNNPCCKQPYCDPSFSTPATLSPQSTLVPGVKTAACVYNGAAYSQGSQWMDGCDFQCVCEDADAGRYRCDQRCPKHTDIPTGCQLVTDPDDTCCQAVECAPSLVPTAAPLPYPLPYPIPVKIPGKKTGQLVGTNNTGCMYNGKEYKQGDSWDDGCSFKCRCLDDNTGVYECDERCVQYTNLPQTCQLVPDPADNCCEVPKCADVNPSPAPTPSPKPGDPTLAPGQGGPTPSTKAPGIAPPKTDFCVYNGRSYTQGQVWYDGCAQMCVCEDAQSNYYRCKQRCAEYNNVPLTCVMVPDPNDPACCQRPDCGSDPSVNVTGYTGKVSGFGTPPTTVAPSPGMVPSTVAPPFPVFPTPPRVNDACLYKGVYYSQGQKWRDGCDYNCECIDGTTGKYECIELCPNYVNTASCPLVRDTSNPCCLVPSCTPSALTTLVPGPGQPTPPTLPTPYPVLFTTVVPQKAFCVYNGVPYKQYDEWADGCDYRCRCEDAVNNQVNCDQRCSTYANLPAECSLVTDPSDQCCQVPVCVPTPGQSPNTPVSGVLGSFTGKYLPGGSQNPVPQDVCVYHGRTYKQGEQWRDGCMYNCSCLDATQGLYGCTERCLRYPRVPQGCQLIPDPQDACCEVIDCPTPAPATVLPPVTITPGPGGPTPTPGPGGPTPTPGPGVSTLTPGPGDPTPTPGPGGPTPSPGPVQMTAVPPTADACLYDGQYYRQGQIWYSGCSSVCSCDNATTNYYTCRERCRRYDSVPRECVMIPDPSDPSCCSVPNCPLVQPGAVPTPGPIPATQKPGSIVGIGKVPTPAPMINPAYYTGPTMVPPTSAPGCVYDGTVYKQGDQWSDACLWDCECEDATQGLYRCTEKCPPYYSTPPECVMMTDPANPCCSIPYCDFMNPSPFPNGIPTLVPGQKPINVTGVVTNFEGNNEFCVYKGVFYQQGQEWMDGCDYKCVCDDGKTGYYTCTDRCPTYFDVSPQCSIITDPSDQCCTIPSCPAAPTLAPGITPTPGTGSTLTPPTTQAPQYVLQPRPPAVFTGQGGTPIRQPNSITGYQTGFTAACVYKGQFYKQDQAFDDGCQYKCTCEDAQTGRFRCVERCAKYLSVPPVCTMETDPNDICCEVPKCPSAQTPTPPAPNTTAVSPTTVSPKSTANPPTGSTVTTMKPPTGTTATTKIPPPESTMSTQSPPTASTMSQKPPTTPPDMCIYNGKAHVQGDIWADDTNCAYRCLCDDAANNIYSCNSNCPIFAELPSYCTLVDDPASQCCKKPDCQVNGQNVTTLVPIGTVDVISGSSGRGTTPGICVYNGQQYKAGDSWYDGCDLSCTCGEDGGVYTCVSRCPLYPPAPAESNCKYISVPGQCCSTLQCNITGVGTYTPVPQIGAVPQQVVVGSTSAPITGQNTPSPQIWVIPGMYGNITGNGAVPGGANNSSTGGVSGYRDKCIANNQLYSQGETWNLDCDMQCQCVDAFTGYYTCTPTCLKYDSALLPKSCSLVKKDCCQVPQCQGPDGSIIDPVANPNPALPIAGYVGGGFSGSRPSYLDGRNTSTTGQRDGCVYKGVLYKNGDTWDDGCDYSCTCIDNVLGQYMCYERCPTYQNVPALCRLVDQPGECCKTLQCDPVPTVAVTTPSGSGTASTQSPSATTASPQTGSEPYDPNCHDSLANCKSYGRSACQSPYIGWAKAHCPLYCGFCTPSYTTTPIPCVDLKNCPLYGANVCTKFKGWAETNCRKYCNLCGPNATPPVSSAPRSTLPTSTPAPGECADRVNCKAYGAYVCSEPQYTTWAANNCPKFCGQCGDETTVATTPATAGVCVYKNVSYGQDETWKDGCAYDCSCVNATSGRYVCNTLCANYPNLPAECRLVTKPGECCAEPVCNGIAPLKGCYYKGTAYSEGAQWTDGCDFDCICLNSTTGDFRCKAICPHWDLPAQCTLGEPEPGLCCPTPKCPFTWVPPAGYVPR